MLYFSSTYVDIMIVPTDKATNLMYFQKRCKELLTNKSTVCIV